MRVLLVTMGNEFGGIEKMELDWLRYINKEQIQFDFLTPNNLIFKNYEKEMKRLGSSCYSLNIKRDNIKNKMIYAYRLKIFFKQNKFDIIHINSSAFFFSFQIALMAKLCKEKCVISHSHSISKCGIVKSFFINLLNPLYRLLVDEFISCSEIAKQSLFSKGTLKKKEVKILKNGIDTQKFKFDEKTRNEIRKEYNVEKKIVYGHIGRFDLVKNHNKLIDIFYEIQRKQCNSILMLIGSGDLEEILKEKINELGIQDKVIFTGFQDEVYKYYNCMDFFIFPSISEGMGISLIEAQTNGLVCYVSNTIPKESRVLRLCKNFYLEEDNSEIANKILNDKTKYDRKSAYSSMKKKGYDIKSVCKQLSNIYGGIK